MTARRESVADRHLLVIRKNLQAYADRGIFRGFSESKSGRFQFVWMLNHDIELIADTGAGTLEFRRLLPGVPVKSALYTELKQYLDERHDRRLPAHRRVDRRRAELSCASRAGFLSVTLQVKNNQYAYGVNRLVNLAHELFVHLRNHYPDYLMENFDVPQE
ncbi:MAG: hypothetical protein ACKV2V_30610 [Blastocatellia bacterium]